MLQRVNMGVLPLQFMDGQSAQTLGLTGHEKFDIERPEGEEGLRVARIIATSPGKPPVTFEVRSRIDTPKEQEYYRHGGILQYVLRQMVK